MLCVAFIFNAILILATSIVQCNPTSQDVMPSQDFGLSAAYVNKIEFDLESLKVSNEILKGRLELQQILFEQRLAKMEILINKLNNTANAQASEDQQQLLFEQLFKKLDEVVIEIKNLQQMTQNNTLNRNIDTNLQAVLETRNSTEKVNRTTGKSNSEHRSETEIFSSCAEALKTTRRNGVYTIKLQNYGPNFEVYCENNILGQNWTVIQRRQDGSVDFYRNWTEYQKGFGDVNGEFFIGLDKLHALTSESRQELLILLVGFNDEIALAKYDDFAISGESQDYALTILGSYSGNAVDSMQENKKMKFTTMDRDNDKDSTGNCANQRKGAWWYYNCSRSNLNGPYFDHEKKGDCECIYWYHWKSDCVSLKRVQMLIRPKTI